MLSEPLQAAEAVLLHVLLPLLCLHKIIDSGVELDIDWCDNVARG